MAATLSCSLIRSMLDAATAQIRAHHEMLSRLDGAVGDGDHGTTILRAMEAVSKTAAEHSSDDARALLAAVGWAVMSCDGGSTGPLLGSFFAGMSEPIPNGEGSDAVALASSFEAGLVKLQKQSRAKVGDKTMMDAFIPAIEALKSANPSLGPKAAMQQAAAAAAQGAEATKNMRAKFGRARNLGDRVIGHPDPGAVSVSLLFKGFSDAL